MSDGLGLVISPDHEATIASLAQTPVSFRVKDLDSLPREWMSEIPVRNQGSFSCCVGGGLSGCFEHRQWVETGEFVRSSMWQAYIESQRASGFLGSDQGAALHGALEAAGRVGVALNSLCPMPSSYTTHIPEEAIRDAANHKHLGNKAYDARSWDVMVDWVTNKDPLLFGGIWTSALDQLNPSDYIIRPKHLKSGTRRGYHAEYLCGWEYVDGILCPRIRNTHGEGHARGGVAVISRDAWDVYMQDPNTVVLAFGDIQEREPKRRSWAESKPGDEC